VLSRHKKAQGIAKGPRAVGWENHIQECLVPVSAMKEKEFIKSNVNNSGPNVVHLDPKDGPNFLPDYEHAKRRKGKGCE
jgi:hypothetical protein